MNKQANFITNIYPKKNLFNMDFQIENDFKKFHAGFNSKMIDYVMKYQNNFHHYPYPKAGNIRYKVIYDKKKNHYDIYGSCPPKENTSLIPGLLTLVLEKYSLPNLDFLYFHYDGFLEQNDIQVPVFTSCKNTNCDNPGVHFVEWTIFLDNVGYGVLNENCLSFYKKLENKFLWKNRYNSLCWRGLPTDAKKYFSEYDLENIKQFPRGRLCNLSCEFPNVINAKFVKNDVDKYIKSDQVDSYNSYPFFSKNWKIYDHLKYKYQILIDGTVATFGYAWRFFSNSVIFKQETNYSMWFYEGLEPWVNYVPVNEDLSDLMKNLKFIIENDEIAKNIAYNSKCFAETYFTKNMIIEYAYKALIKYSTLFLDEVSIGVDDYYYCSISKN